MSRRCGPGTRASRRRRPVAPRARPAFGIIRLDDRDGTDRGSRRPSKGRHHISGGVRRRRPVDCEQDAHRNISLVRRRRRPGRSATASSIATPPVGDDGHRSRESSPSGRSIEVGRWAGWPSHPPCRSDARATVCRGGPRQRASSPSARCRPALTRGGRSDDHVVCGVEPLGTINSIVDRPRAASRRPQRPRRRDLNQGETGAGRGDPRLARDA